jgi:hypothetical protein
MVRRKFTETRLKNAEKGRRYEGRKVWGRGWESEGGEKKFLLPRKTFSHL